MWVDLGGFGWIGVTVGGGCVVGVGGEPAASVLRQTGGDRASSARIQIGFRSDSDRIQRGFSEDLARI